MSRREDLFLTTPYSLLGTPEYGRFFDGSAIGYLYRVLRTRVWRKGTASLRFSSPTGWVTALAEYYDQGWLTAYVTIDTLVEDTGFSAKAVRSHINKLSDLKLLRHTAFGDGFIVLLGKRLMVTTTSGLKVGDNHEGFFIDEWESWLERNPYEFRKMVIEELASPVQKTKFLSRLEKEFEDSGKNFSQGAEKFFPEDTSTDAEKKSSRTDDAATQESQRIDKNRIVKRYGPPNGEPEPIESVFTSTSAAVDSIRDADTWEDAVKSARLAISENIPLKVVNDALSSRSDRLRYRQYPRFSAELLSFDVSGDKPHVGLAKLFASLHEDVTGVAASASKTLFAEAVGVFKNSLLKEFSAEQCLWTFHRVLQEGSEVGYFSSRGRAVLTVTRKHSKQYQEVLAEQHKARMEAEASKIREERAREEEALREARANEPLSKEAKEVIESAKRYANRQKKVKEYLHG